MNDGARARRYVTRTQIEEGDLHNYSECPKCHRIQTIAITNPMICGPQLCSECAERGEVGSVGQGEHKWATVKGIEGCIQCGEARMLVDGKPCANPPDTAKIKECESRIEELAAQVKVEAQPEAGAVTDLGYSCPNCGTRLTTYDCPYCNRKAEPFQEIVDGGEVIQFEMDGNQWCAYRRDSFVNLMKSRAGFGETPMRALVELLKAESVAPSVEELDAVRRLHGLVETVANAYRGYLPGDDEPDADTKTRLAFIEDNIRKADEIVRAALERKQSQ
jgi:hypothetical protein